ncbi:MAG: hypothetical protein GX936_01920 [Clostridiales bacterium]|nr:hypothetical protein [Clostridiales bacterium]
MKVEWILCPVCKNKTRIRIRGDTILENFSRAIRESPLRHKPWIVLISRRARLPRHATSAGAVNNPCGAS